MLGRNGAFGPQPVVFRQHRDGVINRKSGRECRVSVASDFASWLVQRAGHNV